MNIIPDKKIKHIKLVARENTKEKKTKKEKRKKNKK